MSRVLSKLLAFGLLGFFSVLVHAENDVIQNPPAERDIFFGTDSAVIEPQYDARLAAHGQYLAANPQVRAGIKGHTDNRGSREYNLALGERRVQSVLKKLTAQGARLEQFDTVSFGEEIRIRRAGDAAAMSHNRRIEIYYAD